MDIRDRVQQAIDASRIFEHVSELQKQVKEMTDEFRAANTAIEMLRADVARVEKSLGEFREDVRREVANEARHLEKNVERVAERAAEDRSRQLFANAQTTLARVEVRLEMLEGGRAGAPRGVDGRLPDGASPAPPAIPDGDGRAG